MRSGDETFVAVPLFAIFHSWGCKFIKSHNYGGAKALLHPPSYVPETQIPKEDLPRRLATMKEAFRVRVRPSPWTEIQKSEKIKLKKKWTDF